MITSEMIEIVEFIEDKRITEKCNWFFHATPNEIDRIKKMLDEGIKARYLRDDDYEFGYNGKYYISLFKNDEEGYHIRKKFNSNVKFIIENINPYYADKSKFLIRKQYINTKIPLRTSDWEGEYQVYSRVDPSNFVGLNFEISNLISSFANINMNNIMFLRDLVNCINESKLDLPIYDLSTHRELNKDKILSLKL